MRNSLSWALAFAVAATLGLGSVLVVYYSREIEPAHHTDELDHFKYGSIGAEINGYPYLVWRELPTLFPNELPNGWQTFGFIQERSGSLPVGVSVRRYGIDRVGFNCATCHTTLIEGQIKALAGAPADQLDLQRYLRFLIKTGQDRHFTADSIFEAAAANHRPFGGLDQLVFRLYVIPQIRSRLVAYETGAGAWMKTRPDHGPGRTDAGNPWRERFGMRPERDLLTGAVDMPSLWQQHLREKSWMHWDGNNGSLAERNLSAALAGGATEESLDHPSIERVAAWSMDLPIPRYPYPVLHQLAVQGRQVYLQQSCASCHDKGGPRFGKTTPLQEIGTDPQRVNLFSKEMVAAFRQVGEGKPWQFSNYRKSDGYANAPLDGIWARAPYLHNGSVPTLNDLLLPPQQRPAKFRKGCKSYDPTLVGRSCDSGFLFDTSLLGNSNEGHTWGTSLDTGQRAALIEYLKTL